MTNDLITALARVGELPEKWKKRRRSYKPLLQARNEGFAAAADELAAIISQHLPELQACVRYAGRYHELLLAVGNKYADETRHETALRYIRYAESNDSEASDAAIEEGG